MAIKKCKRIFEDLVDCKRILREALRCFVFSSAAGEHLVQAESQELAIARIARMAEAAARNVVQVLDFFIPGGALS